MAVEAEQVPLRFPIPDSRFPTSDFRLIPHSFEVYAKGDHGSHIRERFEQKVVPFFTRIPVPDGIH